MMAMTSLETDIQDDEVTEKQDLETDNHLDYYMEHGEYFEGDLKISQDVIDAYYGKNPVRYNCS